MVNEDLHKFSENRFWKTILGIERFPDSTLKRVIRLGWIPRNQVQKTTYNLTFDGSSGHRFCNLFDANRVEIQISIRMLIWSVCLLN